MCAHLLLSPVKILRLYLAIGIFLVFAYQFEVYITVCKSDARNTQVICWRDVLEEFSLEITQLHGKLHTNANGLSSLPTLDHHISAIHPSPTLLQQYDEYQR